MFCEHLSLTNFRNYVRLELELPPGATLLVGANAQGKTNLLEAVYYLATTRSFRSAVDRELVNWSVAGDELQFSRLAGRVQHGRDTVAVEIVMRPTRLDGPGAGAAAGGSAPGANGATAAGPGGKRIRVNGAPKRAIDLIGQINVVAFAPQDVDLVCGSPAGRRRYLDITISQIDHRYVRTLALYQKVLLQRNSLLRLIREGRGRPDQLGYWDEELASAGAFVIRRRAEAITAMQRLAEGIHRSLTGLRERLDLRYAPNLPLRAGDATAETADQAEVVARFRRELKSALANELRLAQSLVGPHRDDLIFQVDGVDMNAYGSRGQQRTVALSLKLAELQLMREATGQLPILLLDDVMSELDEARRSRVLGAIEPGQQVLATATDLDQFRGSFAADATVLAVRHGTVAPVTADRRP